ncbi:Cytochrome b5 domain-containing protein 1 [Nucella lapillus]
MYVDPETGCRAPHTPQGRFLHVPLPYPDSSWSTDLGRPWWKDLTLCVGSLTRKSQFINIVNTLTSQQHVVEVCSEETIDDILQRYLFYNAHAASYTWKYEQKPLIMNKTLSENHILDEDEDFYNLSIDDNIFRQTVHLYFNDDLTEA